MEIHGPADRPGRPGADRRAGVRPVPDRPGAARPAAGAARARDRRPPHRGLARRDHRPDARRRPVDRRGAARPPGQRAAPGAGPDADLGGTRPPGRPGPGPRGRPDARRPAGRARPPARRAAPGVGAAGVGRPARPGRGAAGGLGAPGGHRGVLPGSGRDHRPGAGDRPGAGRTRRSCARPSTPPWWPWSCPAIRPCCGPWAEASSRRR